MSFEINQAELGAGTLTCHVGGAGKPVLYLHSAGGVVISPPLEALAEAYRLWIPVAPGFDGTAPLPAVAGIRDYVSRLVEFSERHVGERFDVIGSSFGSWVALWLAVVAPRAVDHLILEVPAGFRFGGKGGQPADPEARMKALYAHPERAPAPKSPEAVEANRRTYEAMTGGIILDEELSGRLPEIEAVTLILLGTEDPVVPPEAGAHLKRTIPQSQRVFVYDAAHAIEIDQPERVTRLWREFLGRGAGFVLNQGSAG